jgi:dTDP-4-dehydrorhamnose reductase
MKPINILVTGANSQLGKTLQEYTHLSTFNINFTNFRELDITDKIEIRRAFRKKKYDYCFNFAAYTDVNMAEYEREKCLQINAEAVENLSKTCKKHGVTLVHISTDFVFNGKKNTPYTETDDTYTLNYYGQSKLSGEELIKKQLDEYFIIRTSWLYSKYNNNFVKTISHLAQTNKPLKIVADQIGTPTYAVDLIDFILRIITSKNNKAYGLYHYSNSGSASWFEFGKEIVKNLQIDKQITPVETEHLEMLATRPAYSVLSKVKAKNIFGVKPRSWQEALAAYFNNL